MKPKLIDWMVLLNAVFVLGVIICIVIYVPSPSYIEDDITRNAVKAIVFALVAIHFYHLSISIWMYCKIAELEDGSDSKEQIQDIQEILDMEVYRSQVLQARLEVLEAKE